jgi:hypothetical protein
MSNQSRKRYRTIYIGLAVFIAYAGLACITTWPLVTRMSTRLPGNSEDVFVHYWNGWWAQRALSRGHSPLYTRYLFYPDGVSLITHNWAWFHILPWLLLEPLLNGVMAYNVVLLVSLALCGCSVFCLTYRLTADPRAALLAGLIYQAWPFRLSQLDHPNLLVTYWMPFFFLFLISAIRRGRWRDGLFTGLSFAFVGYTRWQQLIPAAVMGLTFLVFTAPQWLSRQRRPVLGRLVLAGSLSVVALLPPALVLLSHQSTESATASLLREGEEEVMQTDLLAYITPAGSHPVMGGQTQPLYDDYYQDRIGRRYPAYIGFVALSLSLIGVWFKRREVLPWVMMAILLILLALGPLLRVNGQLYRDVPTLYRALSPLVFFRLMRVPDRYNVFLALPVSVLAAYGAQGLLAHRRWNGAWRAVLLCGLLGGLVFFEYLATPVSLWKVSSFPSFYAQMADEPGDFAVLNLPFDPLKAKTYMLHQVTHDRPILQGKTARLPTRAYAYVDSNPWLRALRQAGEMPPGLIDVGRQLTHLAEDNIRYVIIHKWFEGAERVAHWRRYLLTEPRFEDGRIVVYTTAPQAGRDFESVEELIPGLGPIDFLVSADCLSPNRVFEVDVGWGSSGAPSRDLDVALSLVDSQGVVRQSERFPLSTLWPTGQWPPNAVAWGYYTLLVSPLVPAGDYTVTLDLLDAETGHSWGRSMAIQPVTVQPAMCNLATVPEAKDVNALFGNELRLLEYELQREERRLNLTLYWRPERRIDTDYKVFVHVFDPATGIPVAQDDAMPRHWAYPTTYWWPAEAVDDRISISLDDVPAGSYGIAIGVYEPATGERLSLLNNQEELIADGRFILEETVELE